MNTETNIEKTSIKTASVSTVTLAHAVHDTYASFLPALLPLLIEKFLLTNTAAGLLTVFYQTPSFLQPLIGHLADHNNLRLLIILAPSITGIAMSFLSIAPTYGVLVVLLVLAGISSSTLHATGPVMGSSGAEDKLGRGLSFWMVGGELGRALGPLITVTAVGFLTLERFPWLMMAGVLTSIYLYFNLNNTSTKPKVNNTEFNWKSALRKMRRVMVPLVFVLLTRAVMVASLTTFLPTFLINEGSSLLIAGLSLTIFQVSGMVGAILAGNLSDKFGRRKMLFFIYLITPIFMFFFSQNSGLIQIILLIMVGIFASSTLPVILAVVLENHPDNRSFANGIFMAVNFTLLALSVSLVGILSDLFDLRLTFMISAILIPFGLPFIAMLPKTRVVIEK